MSDYEYEGRSGYPLAVLIPSFIVSIVVMFLGIYFVILPMIDDYNKNMPTQEQIRAYQQLGKQTEKTLSDSNISCEQIQNMRQLHVQQTDSTKDPLYWKSNFDTARDLWNAKNCGNHWGWFES